jgi:hypothetical protein
VVDGARVMVDRRRCLADRTRVLRIALVGRIHMKRGPTGPEPPRERDLFGGPRLERVGALQGVPRQIVRQPQVGEQKDLSE